MMKRIGITSTIPVEIVLAAGCVPVDLNNLFINDPEPGRFVRYAEEAGYPRTICGWIKGLFGLVMKTRCVDAVIALTQGDCSSTLALVETLMVNDVPVIPFEYPFGRDADLLRLQIEKLAGAMDTDIMAAQEWMERLRPLRRKLVEVDTLTWRERRVSGRENNLFLLSASDFCGDPAAFEGRVDDFLAEARLRKPMRGEVNIGYIGVPSIWEDTYEYLESQGARVVYNEVQRQFSMPFNSDDIVQQYLTYTYPYGVFARLDDIASAVAERNIDGIVHYTQSFCFRQIEDMIFRKKLPVPVLTLEGDQPARLDGRTKLRINAFIEMLKENRTTRPTQLDGLRQGVAINSGKDS
ncbi:MAG: 2-hydroxyacyl-CoA dehydratase family protein [Candidatus Abyssubacteria bacterium]